MDGILKHIHLAVFELIREYLVATTRILAWRPGKKAINTLHNVGTPIYIVRRVVVVVVVVIHCFKAESDSFLRQSSEQIWLVHQCRVRI